MKTSTYVSANEEIQRSGGSRVWLIVKGFTYLETEE